MTGGRESQTRVSFYYGWVIVGVVALSGFTQSAGTFPVLGVLLNPITNEFGWSHTVFTGATSIGTIIGGVVALVVGPMVDRVGARWILVAAFTALGASFVLMAGITELWQFYALQIVSRVSNMGVIALATQVIIPKWFVERRGRAVALGSLGIMAGNAVTPLYVQYVLGIWGWRWASASAGIVIWSISLVPVAMFLRRQPEDMGLLPDGVTREEMERRMAAGVDGGGARGVGPEISLVLRQVVRLRSFYLLVVAFSLAFMVFPGLLLHLIPYLTEQGIDPALGVWVVAIWSASGALGSLAAGLLSERYGARLSLAASFVLMAGGFGFLLTVDSIQLSLVWGAYMG
ncbi:MAG: MFS transporter, partial [Chloroflexi bacterium]|nr:MFS transporter [Chloroflexota bacterium]